MKKNSTLIYIVVMLAIIVVSAIGLYAIILGCSVDSTANFKFNRKNARFELMPFSSVVVEQKGSSSASLTDLSYMVILSGGDDSTAYSISFPSDMTGDDFLSYSVMNDTLHILLDPRVDDATRVKVMLRKPVEVTFPARRLRSIVSTGDDLTRIACSGINAEKLEITPGSLITLVNGHVDLLRINASEAGTTFGSFFDGIAGSGRKFVERCDMRTWFDNFAADTVEVNAADKKYIKVEISTRNESADTYDPELVEVVEAEGPIVEEAVALKKTEPQSIKVLRLHKTSPGECFINMSAGDFTIGKLLADPGINTSLSATTSGPLTRITIDKESEKPSDHQPANNQKQ